MIIFNVNTLNIAQSTGFQLPHANLVRQIGLRLFIDNDIEWFKSFRLLDVLCTLGDVDEIAFGNLSERWPALLENGVRSMKILRCSEDWLQDTGQLQPMLSGLPGREAPMSGEDFRVHVSCKSCLARLTGESSESGGRLIRRGLRNVSRIDLHPVKAIFFDRVKVTSWIAGFVCNFKS